MKPEGWDKMTDPESPNEIMSTIVTMWRQHYSAGQITSVLREKGHALTRNAVIGRVHRMQKMGVLDKRNVSALMRPKLVKFVPREEDKLKPTRKQFIPDRKVKAEMITARKLKHEEPRLKNVDTGVGVSIMELPTHGCRWVMDYRRNDLPVFCGKPEHKRSMCEAHYSICYYTLPKKFKPYGFR